MRVCTKKKHVSHEKSWISMLNSAGIQQKTSYGPAYNNLYAYAASISMNILVMILKKFNKLMQKLSD